MNYDQITFVAWESPHSCFLFKYHDSKMLRNMREVTPHYAPEGKIAVQNHDFRCLKSKFDETKMT